MDTLTFPLGITGTTMAYLLKYYYQNNAIIPEVFVRDTQADEELSLVAVRIVTVGLDVVIFEQVTSPGVGLVLVRISEIVAMDLPS